MKKYAAIALSFIAVVCMVTALFAGIRRAQTMQVRFNKLDIPEHGVHLIIPVDPSFGETASKYFNDKAPDTLTPFSVFIKNSGQRLVLAYALTWDLSSDGKTITSKTVVYSEPGVLMGNEIPKSLEHTTAIEPNAVRCFTLESQIERNAPARLQGSDPSVNAIREMIASRLSAATDVTVTLDGVLFDDGTLIGSNKSGFFEHMQAVVNAKVDLLRKIAIANQEGRVEDALKSITEISREPDVPLGAQSSVDDYYLHFRRIYAREITMKYFNYGKENLVPFLVRSYERARPVLKNK